MLCFLSRLSRILFHFLSLPSLLLLCCKAPFASCQRPAPTYKLQSYTHPLFCDKRREEVSNVSLGQHFGKTSANISQEDVMAHDKEPKKRRDRQPMTTIQILFPVCHPDQFSLFDVGLGQNLVEDALSELLKVPFLQCCHHHLALLSILDLLKKVDLTTQSIARILRIEFSRTHSYKYLSGLGHIQSAMHAQYVLLFHIQGSMS